MVEGVEVAMAAAEQAGTVAVEQADDGRVFSAHYYSIINRRTQRQVYHVVWYHSTICYFLSPAVLEQAPNWIVSNPPCSAFSVLQLGYELKKNEEQNTERVRRTPDNVYPKYIGTTNMLEYRRTRCVRNAPVIFLLNSFWLKIVLQQNLRFDPDSRLKKVSESNL